MGFDWIIQRDRCLERDGYTCQRCAKTSNLDVHHIRPRKSFDDPSESHYLANLVTVCRRCHGKIEGTDKNPRLGIKHVDLGPIVEWAEGTTIIDVAKTELIELMVDSLFKEIQRDAGICTNCFQRYEEHYEINFRWDPVSEYPRAIRDSVQDIVGGEVYTTDQATFIPQEPASHGTRIACECGTTSDETRPLDKRTFFSYAANLADVIEDSDADFDRRAFFDYLEDLKTDPDKQFKDDSMYEQALGHAISVGGIQAAD